MLKYVTCGWTFRVDPHHRSSVPNEIWGFFGCKTRRNPAVETTSPPKSHDFGVLVVAMVKNQKLIVLYYRGDNVTSVNTVNHIGGNNLPNSDVMECH